MRSSQLLALVGTGVLFTLVAATAQQNPPGKLPQVKPGDPGKFPQVKPGDPKNPVDPNKNKNPIPMNPGMGVPPVNPGMGVPPVIVVPGTQPNPPMPPKKDAAGNWPKEIGGKKLSQYVREMRENSDPAIREAAIRVLPAFGPDAQDMASKNLLYALTKDPDINVRLAAMSVVPVLGFDEPDVTEGLGAVFNYLGSESSHIRYEACVIVAQIGPFPLARKNAIPKLIARGGETTSWRIRQAANVALGSVGRGITNPENPEQRIDPEQPAVDALLRSLRSDSAAPVRREAANSLIAVGPVAAPQVKNWRTSLETAIKTEKDKSVALWARVVLLKNDPLGIKANEAHLSVVSALLTADEAGGRLEACQALGVLGDDVRFKVKDLLDVITNPKEESEVVSAAIQAVSGMKSQAAITIPVLQKVKETHKNEDVRKLAGEVLDFLEGKKPAAKKN